VGQSVVGVDLRIISEKEVDFFSSKGAERKHSSVRDTDVYSFMVCIRDVGRGVEKAPSTKRHQCLFVFGIRHESVVEDRRRDRAQHAFSIVKYNLVSLDVSDGQ